MEKVLFFVFAVTAAISFGGMKMAAPKKASFTVDAELPAGNAIIEKIDGDTVRLKQDLRDSGLWFYWRFV